jgi:hypothetical membrane protein
MGITMNSRQLAWGGIVGPTLFVTVFLIEGWLRPGYDPLKVYVSELSLGPRGWIQIANFVVFGLLLLAFTRRVAFKFGDGKASRGGILLLTILAICFLLSGPFVMDPTHTPPNQITIHGTLHGILGGIVFSLMPVSCFVFLRRFREDPKWQGLQWWTLTLGTASAAAVVLLTIATKIPALQSAFTNWLGLIQRLAIVPFMLWLFTFALGLLRQDKTSQVQ